MLIILKSQNYYFKANFILFITLVFQLLKFFKTSLILFKILIFYDLHRKYQIIFLINFENYLILVFN